VKAELNKNIYLNNEPIRVSISVKNELLTSVTAIKVFIKQSVALYQKEHSQEFSVNLSPINITRGLPIKRNTAFRGNIQLTPKLNDCILKNPYNIIALKEVLSDSVFIFCDFFIIMKLP
jgi:acetyltransferase-like isoleucine patch superfamily enzyme